VAVGNPGTSTVLVVTGDPDAVQPLAERVAAAGFKALVGTPDVVPSLLTTSSPDHVVVMDDATSHRPRLDDLRTSDGRCLGELLVEATRATLIDALPKCEPGDGLACVIEGDATIRCGETPTVGDTSHDSETRGRST
jgi:hypothetical protein